MLVVCTIVIFGLDFMSKGSLFNGGLFLFMPIFANDILHSGARGLGLLMSAAGVGAVLGALQFAARTSYPTTMALTTLTVLIGAVFIVAVGREKRGIHFGSDLVIPE